MQSVNLDPGEKTPGVSLDGSSGAIKLWGRSIPEDSVGFYGPVFEWLDEYAGQPSGTTIAEFRMEYFNTSSSKCLLDIFRKLEGMHKGGKTQVQVKWLYEEDDEDMMEAGEDYETIVELPFSIEVG
jgi:hypothetical protein